MKKKVYLYKDGMYLVHPAFECANRERGLVMEQKGFRRTQESGSAKCGSGVLKAGFTLMELMVYIAIMGIVVLVAGQAFSDSTKIRIRTQSMVEANEVAETAASLLKDDVAQMGAKVSVDQDNSTSTTDKFYMAPEVYMDPENTDVTKIDSSSFNLSVNQGGEGLDSLTIRRMNYTSAGVYKRVEEIAWYAKNGVLYRSCKTVAGNPDSTNCPSGKIVQVEIATGIDSFKVQPSKPGVLGDEGLLFPKDSSDLSNKGFRFISRYGVDNYTRVVSSPASGATAVSINGFVSNYREDGSTVSDPVIHQVFVAKSGSTSEGWQGCKEIKFMKDSTYEIAFDMVNNNDEARMFQPGVDHFAVGLRNVSGTEPAMIPDVPDYHFYPPENDKGNTRRSVRFSTHSADSVACVVFTFAFYAPTAGMGQLTIANLEVRRAGDMDYVFVDGYNPQIVDKKNVRALKLRLIAKRNGEAGNAELVIPLPSNGID